MIRRIATTPHRHIPRCQRHIPFCSQHRGTIRICFSIYTKYKPEKFNTKYLPHYTFSSHSPDPWILHCATCGHRCCCYCCYCCCDCHTPDSWAVSMMPTKSDPTIKPLLWKPPHPTSVPALNDYCRNCLTIINPFPAAINYHPEIKLNFICFIAHAVGKRKLYQLIFEMKNYIEFLTTCRPWLLNLIRLFALPLAHRFHFEHCGLCSYCIVGNNIRYVAQRIYYTPYTHSTARYVP